MRVSLAAYSSEFSHGIVLRKLYWSTLRLEFLKSIVQKTRPSRHNESFLKPLGIMLPRCSGVLMGLSWCREGLVSWLMLLAFLYKFQTGCTLNNGARIASKRHYRISKSSFVSHKQKRTVSDFFIRTAFRYGIGKLPSKLSFRLRFSDDSHTSRVLFLFSGWFNLILDWSCDGA